MATTYIHFTEEQKDQARRTDLRSFLLGQGEKVERSGSEYKWNHGGEKITIRGNLWFNQYEPDSGGGDAIAFAREFYGLDFPEAVKFLLEQQGVVILPQKDVPAKEKKPFALPAKNEDMRRVYAYLLKARFLDREVVNAFVRAGLLYEDSEYHNAVFVGVDENGIARHAHKRGTYSDSGFKGNVDSSNPDYSFHHIGKSNRLYVFEAPIDMLSYISLHKENWKEHSYVSLCSTATYGAMHILKTNPQIDTVVTCLDHDSAGIEGNYRLKEEILRLGAYTVSAEQPRFKDWNEGLKSEHGIKPIPGTEHPGLVRMKTLCQDLAIAFTGDRCPKYPLDELREQYQKLKQLSMDRPMDVIGQSSEMAGIAFLLGQKQFASLEKSYTVQQYEKILLRLYAPHHDRIGYKARIAEIGERLEEIGQAFQKNEILPESAQMEQIKNTLSLSVDCLRLYAYVEREQIESQRRKSPCQTEPSPMAMQQ